jgi:hypothetical protein
VRVLSLLLAFAGVACSDAGDGPGNGDDPQPVLGRACVPQEESVAEFSSYAIGETVLYENEPECEGLACVVIDFQGRVSCPYGQTQEEIDTLPAADPARCRTSSEPGGTSSEPVTVPVAPQLVGRRATDAVTCSCQCAGSDPNAEYCTCGSNQVCLDVSFGNSYCVKRDSLFDPAEPPGPTCSKTSTDPSTDCGNDRRNP